jgi:DNA-binding NarL/FixJ family response regulator
MSRVRVVVVDDHEIVRTGLASILGLRDDLEVVALCGDAEEAVAAVERYRPDVVLMDVRLPGRSGIEACREITARWPATHVIMLTSYMDNALVASAVEAGASGYLLKKVAADDLFSSVLAVAHGGATLDPAAASAVLAQLRETGRARTSADFGELSVRELEVLALLAEGRTNAGIADALNLSEKTVANHITTIFSKLGVTNRVEAATFAVRHHIERLRGEAGD